MTTPNDIATLQAKPRRDRGAPPDRERTGCGEQPPASLGARDDHAAHIAAVAAGTASPDAAASPLHDAEFRVSIAQQAVQAIEAEYAETSELLRQARHAARVAAREADLEAAAQLAAEVDAAAALLNEKYRRWLNANDAIGAKHDHVALTGGQWQPYLDASSALSLAAVLHPDVETANRLNIIAPRGATLAERAACA